MKFKIDPDFIFYSFETDWHDLTDVNKGQEIFEKISDTPFIDLPFKPSKGDLICVLYFLEPFLSNEDYEFIDSKSAIGTHEITGVIIKPNDYTIYLKEPEE